MYQQKRGRSAFLLFAAYSRYAVTRFTISELRLSSVFRVG